MVVVDGDSHSISFHCVRLNLSHVEILELSEHAFDPYLGEIIFNENDQTRFHLPRDRPKGTHLKLTLKGSIILRHPNSFIRERPQCIIRVSSKYCLRFLPFCYVNQILNHPLRCHRMKSVLNFLYQYQTIIFGRLNFRDHTHDARFASTEMEFGILMPVFGFTRQKYDLTVIINEQSLKARYILT